MMHRVFDNLYLYLFIILFIIPTLYKNEEKEKYIPKIGMNYINKKDTYKFYNKKRYKIEEENIAVITTLTNYNFEVINSFVTSLDNVKFNGHLILFINKKFKFNNKYVVIHQIIVNNTYPYYSMYNYEFPIQKRILKNYIPNNCHWYTIRYYILSIWLKYYNFKYNYIYYCDGRDVIFQLNPSMWNYGKGVHLTLESDKVKIKDSRINVIWTKEFRMNRTIFENHVINSGTIFGSSKELYNFISQMLFMLKQLNLRCNNDQGTLIYFYYSHPPFTYPVYLERQGYGYALSLVDLTCDSFYTDYCKKSISKYESNVKNLDGTIPIIVHGLERWRNTKNETRRNEYNYFIDKYYPYYSCKNKYI